MPDQPGPASHFFASQRGRLHYVDWGNAGAPTLLLIHGSRDHARSWDWTAAALREAWHVVAVDLRGHGESAWSEEGRYDFATYLYDLAQLVDQLGCGPVTMVGHSFGAHIALRFASLYPDKVARLAAVEPVGAPPAIAAALNGRSVPDRVRGWIAEKQATAGRQPRRYATREDAAARMMAEHPALSGERAHHLARHGAARGEDGSWTWKYDPQLRVFSYPDIPHGEVEALWRAIACPVLLLFGRDSWSSAMPGQLRRALPDATVVELEGAGHWPQHDRFDAFLAALRAFLEPAIRCSS